MPPEESNCLVALRMDQQGDRLAISGARVFAPGSDAVTTVTWYTTAGAPPTGYESVLDGLVFVRSDTVGSRASIDALALTKIDSRYQWNDNAHSGGLMIALSLPQGTTLISPEPQIDEAKVYHERVAVYWYVRPAQNADSRVQVTFQLGSTTHPVVQEVERLNRAVALSRARSPAAHYDVALSFAGEDRKYVHRVAEALAEKGVKVFYDNFEEADLWGKYL